MHESVTRDRAEGGEQGRALAALWHIVVAIYGGVQISLSKWASGCSTRAGAQRNPLGDLLQHLHP